MNEAGGMSFEDYMRKEPVSVEPESNEQSLEDLRRIYQDRSQSLGEDIASINEKSKTVDEYASDIQSEMNEKLATDLVDVGLGSSIGGMGATALGANPVGVTMASLAYPMHKTGIQVMEEEGIPRSRPYDESIDGIPLNDVGIPIDIGRPVKAFNDMIMPTAAGTIETLKGLGEMVAPEGTPDSFESPAEREDYYGSDSMSTAPSNLIRPEN